jgi:hypothetical protein
MRDKSTRQQVMALLAICPLQTPGEAPDAVRGGPAVPPQSQAGPGGFKVGDRVRVLAVGWQEATILQIRGRSY